MPTVNHKQLLDDYEQGKLTPADAVGQSLQHIDKLYEIHSTARYAWQTKLDTLERHVNSHQVTLDRLTAFMTKILHAQKKRSAPDTPDSRQP
ncbi:MAG: hypothetical protein R3E79_04715 [Caldilineaceae bacterium]